VANALAAGACHHTNQIRHTPSVQRTKEEKRWVSMDVLLNPELYAHVTEVEAEEMKFDEEYEVRGVAHAFMT
jgi:hypothetical protein